MTKDLMKINYEGDDLNLTKSDVLNILDQVGTYWAKDRVGNAKRLVSLNIFKGLIRMTSANDVQDIWKIMLKFIDELRYQNYIKGGQDGAEILGLVKKSISEEIFK